MAAAVRKNKTALLAEPDPEWKYYYASILAFCGQEEVAFALTCVYTILNPVNGASMKSCSAPTSSIHCLPRVFTPPRKRLLKACYSCWDLSPPVSPGRSLAHRYTFGPDQWFTTAIQRLGTRRWTICRKS